MNIRRITPNFISLLRILLILPFLYFYMAKETLAFTLIILLILASDFFDGFFARRWNAISRLGKILDPLADKICTALACIILIINGGFPIWLFMVMAARDLIILIGGMVIIKSNKKIPMSNLVGKITIGVYAVGMGVYVYSLEGLKLFADIAIVAMTTISLASYGISSYKKLFVSASH